MWVDGQFEGVQAKIMVFSGSPIYTLTLYKVSDVSIIYYIRTLLTVVARYQPGLYIPVSRSLRTVIYSIYLYSSLCLVGRQSLLNPQPSPSFNRRTHSLALLSL